MIFRNQSNYLVKVPPTRDQGSFSCIAHASARETMRQNALWDYNSARGHDGLAPVSSMPAGTTYTRIKS